MNLRYCSTQAITMPRVISPRLTPVFFSQIAGANERGRRGATPTQTGQVRLHTSPHRCSPVFRHLKCCARLSRSALSPISILCCSEEKSMQLALAHQDASRRSSMTPSVSSEQKRNAAQNVCPVRNDWNEVCSLRACCASLDMC